jgi:serine/threonine protein kinase
VAHADSGLVGTMVAGRYHLVRMLGDGGMGAVYKAADQVLRRFVAIKLLHPKTAQNPASVERFQREARAAAAIGHPNIIEVLDFGRENERPYMVMEYLRGRSLAQVILNEDALPIDRACAIATHTLAGLAATHERGILHRDLKPANLMLVTRLGDRHFVKVCDFGFAALFGGSGQSAEGKTLTPARTLVGTPAYAAPERIRGDERRDPRIDVYSVGVVLYEMLAGQRPFDAPTFVELARKVEVERPISLRALRPEVPEGLEYAVMKALSKSREGRWSSATEFASALVPFGGHTIDIESDGPSASFTFEMMRLQTREVQKGLRSHAPDVVAKNEDDLQLDIAIDEGTSTPSFERAPGHDTDVTIPIIRRRRNATLQTEGGTETPRPLGAESMQVKGRLVLSVIRFASRRFGERAIHDLLGGMPTELRKPFQSGIEPESWVDYDLLRALVERIDAQLGDDDLGIIAACGHAAAEGALGLERKAQPSPPELLLAEVPSLVQVLFRGIELRVRRLGKGYGRLELVESAAPTLTTSVMALGLLEKCLECFGAIDGEATLQSASALGDSETLIDVSWLA